MNAQLLIEKISEKDIFQEKYLKETLAKLSDHEIKALSEIIEFFITQGYDLDYLVKAYCIFVHDTNKEQKYFFDNKKYRYSTYEEVAGHVYNNPEYMHMYMVGLILSQYLWHTHRSLMRWFNQISQGLSGQKYLEIGPGHGGYFANAVLNFRYDSYIAVDISQTSVDMTNNFVMHQLKNNNIITAPKYKILNLDFLNLEEHDFGCVIMGEVLEHVEDPLSFLKKIKEVSTNDAFIYITTVINAPAIDHISLFRNRNELFEVVNLSGMAVYDYFAVTPQPNISMEKAIKRNYPINIALLLKK